MLSFQSVRVHSQKFFRHAPTLYFGYLLLASALSAVLYYHGYEFIVTNIAIWFFLNLLIPTVFTIASIVYRSDVSKFARMVSFTLPLLVILNYYYTDSFVDMVPTGIIAIQALLLFSSCYAVSLLKMDLNTFSIICAILNTILLLGFLALFTLAITFGSLGEKEINREMISPEGTYAATIMTSDSGAVGGATNVFVENLHSSINLGFGRYTKIRQVYSSEWDAYMTIHVVWKDDHTLLINGETFPIKD